MQSLCESLTLKKEDLVHEVNHCGGDGSGVREGHLPGCMQARRQAGIVKTRFIHQYKHPHKHNEKMTHFDPELFLA